MVTKEKDEELALFLEMRRREKQLILHNSNELVLGASSLIGSNISAAGSHVSKTAPFSLPKRTAAENFLYSENEKSDYDWLITPPGTPTVHSSEKESQKALKSHVDGPSVSSNILKSRLANSQQEPASRSTKHPTLTSGQNTSSIGTRRPSSSGGVRSATRSATPTGRATSATRPSRPSTPTSRATLPSMKPVAPPVRPSTPTRSNPRSSTPTTRPSLPLLKSTLPSIKPVPPPVRSSTPTRSTPRSLTPTTRPLLPAKNSTSRSATPTLRASNILSSPTVSSSSSQSSSETRSGRILSKKPAPSRGTSPIVKSRPWKPSEIPGFSHEAPSNLKTSLPERPVSAARGRPVGPSGRPSTMDTGSNGRILRRQSCSPSRGKAPRASPNNTSSSIPPLRRGNSCSSDDVSPVMIGTKMVERVVNMRKLAPPKQEDHIFSHNKLAGSSGFGSTLSKKSLDMAMRHMDIRRTIGGNQRPHITNIPASSMYSVRSVSTKSRTVSVSNSPHAMSSNTGSEPSVNNSPFSLDGSEIEENDF